MSQPSTNRSGGILRRLTSMRARLLAGSFALVFFLWTADMLGQSPGPTKARAAQTPGAGAYVIGDPPDRAALDRFLSVGSPVPDELVFHIARDPFAVPVEAALAAPGAAVTSGSAESGSPASAPSADGDPTRERSFGQTHQLQGVILGERPVALINGNGYRVGDSVDGYRIIAIDRVRVTLRGRAQRVVLEVATPGLKPVSTTP